MYKTIPFIILATTIGCRAQSKQDTFEWNLEKEKIHNENRNDSTKWSLKTRL